MHQLTLYSRQHCHLCDEATSLINQALPKVELKVVDIDMELDLIRRYGDRVPVLCTVPVGYELNWPFDQSALINWLSSTK